jgi:formamidopyrimidine-DNA glycosylase
MFMVLLLIAIVLTTPDTATALHSTRSSRRINLNMVEGHSVHRVASMHRKRLVGKSFSAWSPNGRFTEGANAINGKVFSRIEAVGKNLFAFFDSDGSGKNGEAEKSVVMHVHFGMAGNWAVYMNEDAPEPTKTNRLRLEYPGIVADLSAMTVQHGGMEMYQEKRLKLGEDPLREDADPERLWSRVQKSSKSIGALIMDQSYFTGPGNIYRAEICFKAGIHPNRLGKTLLRQEFDTVWYHTKDLLERGYSTGSILTVDSEEAQALGKPRMRRYIYNTAKCPRCSSSIKSWKIASRTCYACPNCQSLNPNTMETETTQSAGTPEQDVVPFNSHCARESVGARLFESGPSRLTVKELRSQLSERNISFSSNAKKAKLVEILLSEIKPTVVTPDIELKRVPSTLTVKELKAKLMERDVSFLSSAKKATLVELLLSSQPKKKTIDAKRAIFVSSDIAAAEKAAAGESLAVEHIAELAPGQARLARARGLKNTSTKEKPAVPNLVSSGITDSSSRVKRTATRRLKRRRND